MNKKIKTLTAREILDSRGNPTVETQILFEDSTILRASVPSGASKGAHEAWELRDGDAKRYEGLGVENACRFIRDTIWPAISNIDPVGLAQIDARLIQIDGTANKSRLGANTTLAVSLVMAKAGAHIRGIPLYRHIADLYTKISDFKIPTPLMNLINGGKHANNNLNIQEFMIVPEGLTSFKEALRASAEIFKKLKVLIKERGDSIAVGDEGGFAPNSLNNPEEALELLMTARDKAGYKTKISLALDLAASEFFVNGKYELLKGSPALKAQDLIAALKGWCGRYPIVSLEDPLDQDDWLNWAALTKELAFLPVSVIGDDLFVTNPERLKKGIKEKTANAILIKPNQIGTLTETAEVVNLAKRNGFVTIASHRSGETEDSALAHIAVGLGVHGIKTGSLSRSERLAKYNELLRIEEGLGTGCYRGRLA